MSDTTTTTPGGDAGTMTADQMLETWRRLRAQGHDVEFTRQGCTIQLRGKHTGCYMQKFTSSHPDPLTAFAGAVAQFEAEAQGGKDRNGSSDDA